MAGDIFLWLDNIAGESADAVEGAHVRDIEVIDWSWGMANASPLELKTKDASAQPKPTDISVTKHVDAASATLMQYCAKGDPITGGTLACRKNAGESKIEYLMIEFYDAKVRSVKWTADEEGHITEIVTLYFEKFETTYRPQDDETGQSKGSTHFGFDIKGHHEL